MTAGIFGGSFNPVHNGHIALAKAIVERGIVDEVWLSLSPQNPLKDHPEELVDDADRLAMLRLATNGIKGLEVCDIELSLPRPSYTINTLRALSRQYPRNRFRLIIGADNMLVFDRWKDHAEIMRDYNPVDYPRPGYDCPQAITGQPEFPVSSTEIRNTLKRHKPVNKLLPHEVIEYISQRGLYTR